MVSYERINDPIDGLSLWLIVFMTLDLIVLKNISFNFALFVFCLDKKQKSAKLNITFFKTIRSEVMKTISHKFNPPMASFIPSYETIETYPECLQNQKVNSILRGNGVEALYKIIIYSLKNDINYAFFERY